MWGLWSTIGNARGWTGAQTLLSKSPQWSEGKQKWTVIIQVKTRCTGGKYRCWGKTLEEHLPRAGSGWRYLPLEEGQESKSTKGNSIFWRKKEVNKQGNTTEGCSRRWGQLCSVAACCYFGDPHKNSLPVVQKTSFCKWLWESDPYLPPPKLEPEVRSPLSQSSKGQAHSPALINQMTTISDFQQWGWPNNHPHLSPRSGRTKKDKRQWKQWWCPNQMFLGNIPACTSCCICRG